MAIAYSEFNHITNEFDTLVQLLRHTVPYPSDGPFANTIVKDNVLNILRNKNYRYHLQEHVVEKLSVQDFKNFILFDCAKEDDGRFDQLGIYGCMRHFKRSLIDRLRHKYPQGNRLAWFESSAEALSLHDKEALIELVLHRQRSINVENSRKTRFYASKGFVSRWSSTMRSHLSYTQMPNIVDIIPLFEWRRTTGGLLAISNALDVLRVEKRWSSPCMREFTFDEGLVIMQTLLSNENGLTYLSSKSCQPSQMEAYEYNIIKGFQWASQSGVPPECLAHAWMDSYTYSSNREQYGNIWRKLYISLPKDVQTRIADYVTMFFPPLVAQFTEWDCSVGVLPSIQDKASSKALLMMSIFEIEKDFSPPKSSTNPLTSGQQTFSSNAHWGLKSAQNMRAWTTLYSTNTLMTQNDPITLNALDL